MPDHERPLNTRGKSDANLVGEWLRQTNRLPNLIISSTARRARKTAQRVARSAGYEGQVLLYPELYNAPVDHILAVIRSVPGEPQTLLVVGHNPGLSELTSWMSSQAVTLSTATLADMQIDVSLWQQVALGGPATLTLLWKPDSQD